jgi:autoinducer 2 (AI-2) kinase
MQEPGSIVGDVSPAVADETGLPPGVAVVTAGGDAQVAALGMGAVDAGDTAVVGGSFWQQLVNLDRPATDPRMRVRVTCHAIPDRWQGDALVFRAGLVARWFLEAFRGDASHPTDEEFARLEQRAAAIPPGSHGVISVFSNSMDYGNWRHAAPSFLGLPVDDPPADVRAVLFRSILENVAIVARANLELIASATATTPAGAVAFGGGAARSRLWSQILADVLDRPVRVPQVAESTSFGAALCAGYAVGAFDAPPITARVLVRWAREHEPGPEATRVYGEVLERWRAAYAAQEALVRAGVTRPMWSPGDEVNG